MVGRLWLLVDVEQTAVRPERTPVAQVPPRDRLHLRFAHSLKKGNPRSASVYMTVGMAGAATALAPRWRTAIGW